MTAVDDRAAEVRGWYEAAQWRFRAFERAFTSHLHRFFAAAELANHQVESRTKSLESFVAKAVETDPVSPGTFKYSSPRTEITDMVGVRIIVPLSTDVLPVRALLHERYVVEEEHDRGTDELVDVPGYQSLHLLVRLREQDADDPEFRDMNDLVVEVQVRTILQHAWASIQHDLLYKTDRPPVPALKRRLVALAGVLELADREFVQVRHEHGEPPRPTPTPYLQGPMDALTSAAVRSLAENVVGDTSDTDQVWFDELVKVMTALGARDRASAVGLLGPWSSRSRQVSSAVTATRPWANPAFVLDQMLRLQLGETYFDRLARLEEPQSPADARRAFMTERSALLRLVEATT